MMSKQQSSGEQPSGSGPKQIAESQISAETRKKPDQHSDHSHKKTVDRPNNILIDIYGVITSWDFRENLKQYVKNNISDYLTKNYKDKRVTDIIKKLREQSAIDRSAGIQVPLIEEPLEKNLEEVVRSATDNIKWQMENKHSSCQLQLDTLSNKVWADGYTSGKLKVHVFDDVKKTFESWRFKKFVKIYTFASGARDGQKLFLSSTESGDLTPNIANYINSSGGYKYDANKFKVVIHALRETEPQKLLYLTDDPQKARAAIEAGLRAVVVLRQGNTKYTAEQLKDLVTIGSLDELDFLDDPSNPMPCC